MAEPITGFLSDSEVDGQGLEAQRLAKQDPATKRIFPAFARSKDNRARLLNALLGIQAGQAAARQSIELGDPLGAAIAGFSAQAGAPTAERIAAEREALAAQQHVQMIESTPIEHVSPAFIEKFPEFRGLPVGLVDKISPVINRASQNENALQRLMTNLEAMEKQLRERERIQDERDAAKRKADEERQNRAEAGKDNRLNKTLDAKGTLEKLLIKAMNDANANASAPAKQSSPGASKVRNKWGL